MLIKYDYVLKKKHLNIFKFCLLPRFDLFANLVSFLEKTFAKRIFDIIKNLELDSCTKVEGSIQNYCLSNTQETISAEEQLYILTKHGFETFRLL